MSSGVDFVSTSFLITPPAASRSRMVWPTSMWSACESVGFCLVSQSERAERAEAVA